MLLMFARLRRSRRLRLLLACGLVPVVILSNPQTATAANDWHQVHVDPDIAGLPDMGCDLNLQQSDDGQSLSLGGNSYCSGGVDITPGLAQWGEQGSAWGIVVSGTTPGSGAACGGNATGTFGSHSSSGLFNVAGSFGATTVALASNAAGCNIDEVCLLLTPGQGLRDKPTNDCVPVDIPAGQLTEGACPHGDVHGVELEAISRQRAGSTSIWEYWWEVRVYFTDASRYDLWKVTAALTASDPGFSTEWSATGITGMQDSLHFPQKMYATTDYANLPNLIAAKRPYNVEVYALDGERNTGSNGYDTSAAGRPTAYPPALPDGFYRGLTQAPLCRFYFGPKIVDFPNTVDDEPSGPLDDLYTPPSGPVEPGYDPIEVVPEPVETETDFWSGLLGLVRKLLGAIAALGQALADIVSGILDGLVGLFVPDAGFMNSAMRDLRDAWEETTPARYVGALEGFAGGATSGCGGLPLELTLPGGVQVSENIGAACSGTMAQVASVVRMVVSAGLVVGGTFACVRAVGSGFGWNPGIGGRSDA